MLHVLDMELPAEVPGKLGVLIDGLRREPSSITGIGAGPLRPQFLGIIPTRSCNLGCRYCAFGAANDDNHMMDHSLAVASIDWMVRTLLAERRNLLAVDFFGGEPMVAFPVVKTVVDYVHEASKKNRLDHRIEIATNGYFAPDACRFLCENIDFITLSFDGPKEIQNFHRPTKSGHESFDIIYNNAKTLAASQAKLTIRICVTDSTVDRLGKNVEWFCQEFHPDSITVEPLRRTSESVQAGMKVPKPMDFIPMLHKATRIAATYDIPLIYASANLDELRTAFCPMGKDVAIIFPDGSINSCYMQPKDWKAINSNMHYGDIRPVDNTVTLDFSTLNIIRQNSQHHPICHSCFCRWNCAGGCYMHMHASMRKNGQDDFCMQTRILTACNLLNRLGYNELSDKLADDKTAQRPIIDRHSDLLLDFLQRDSF